MVCAGIKSLLLVFLLTTRADAIDPNVLAEIILFTRNTISVTGEYSYLINTNRAACSNINTFKNELQGQLQTVHNYFMTIARGVIDTTNIIAARANNYIHAEHWVLFNNVADVQQRTQNPETCVLFFTKFSPCLERCASPDDAQSIITNLRAYQLFSHINLNWKAFVFYDVYRPDATRLTELGQALTSIGQFMTVYRCTSYRAQGRWINVCYQCATQMQDCLWVPSILYK